MQQTITLSRRRLLAMSALVLPVISRSEAVAAMNDIPPVLQPDNPGVHAFTRRAYEMRQQALELGDQAYGALVVRAGIIVGQAPSRVVVHQDPTAHAEMEAIRDAAHRLQSRDLSNCILYSTSPACPMCESAAYWAGIGDMVYGEGARAGGKPRLCG